MKYQPLLNALLAFIYIIFISLTIRLIESVRHDAPDTIFDAVGVLSLFTLSAAVMSYLFFFTPISLLIQNQKKESIQFFLKTFVTFFLITAVVLLVVFQQ